MLNYRLGTVNEKHWGFSFVLYFWRQPWINGGIATLFYMYNLLVFIICAINYMIILMIMSALRDYFVAVQYDFK